MSPETKDFYGKDVASAIKEACDALGVAQENLTIEVVETGSTGIFGLIRKKAHIRAAVQVQEQEEVRQEPPQATAPAKPEKSRGKKKTTPRHEPTPPRPEPAPPRPEPTPPRPEPTPPRPEPAPPRPEPAPPVAAVAQKPKLDDEQNGDFDLNDEGGEDGEDNGREPAAELSPENLAVIRAELEKVLELMNCPSSVSVEGAGGTAHCRVGSEYEADLTSQEGRTLDSLQYLLRKIIARKIPERVRLTIDIGDYRQRRHDELREQALDYAAQVKLTGKTQIIPSLNPAERRVVHVALQEDTEVRSRSVGDGLFKKVLIYKPGKSRKSSSRSKKARSKPRKKGDSTQKKDQQS